uniref:Uncharacterized protein AlNc14C48G3828 n=1 Tax=Albugo laibachii Nc14 TaxID=890382 RepID=F0WAW7_9STRA|nr:conserved hypothetical protein [Albugo laibachii Nc14]CCA18437.1 conserved hypothetical protein [Albugo laibachii Nc14]|eukprot:CCA18437.1 conserved hypothetical protein [Albugo laibachii Nc14]
MHCLVGMVDHPIDSDVTTTGNAAKSNVALALERESSSNSNIIHRGDSSLNNVSISPIIASDRTASSPPMDKQTFEQLKQQRSQSNSLESKQFNSNNINKNDRAKREDVADLENDVVGAELIDWLQNQGAETKKLMLQQYAPEVRGVHCRNELVPGERILFIPKNCLITVEMGKQTEIGQKVLAHNIEFVAPKHIFLILYLLTDMEKKDLTFFKYYYSTLPSTLKNMPIFWSDQELSWLKGSYILHQIQERKAAIRKDYDAICRADPSFSRFSLERFSWARMIVCSRNFGLTIDGVKTAALVPFADMLNHYRPRETSWTFDQKLDGFTITSLESICSGAQVYDSYGKKCNHRFLLNYGFAVEDNTEEDGSNPNEIMVDFQLDPGDGQLLYDKTAYLYESGIYTMNARLSCSHSDPSTREGFSFARLIAATEDEFSSMKMRSPAHASPPISFRNEIAALNLLKQLMDTQLDQYPTSLDEGEAILKSKEYPLYSNRIQALFFIRGEKQVCMHYKHLAEKVVPLFSLTMKEMKESEQQYFDDDDDICRYAQDVIAYLMSRDDVCE